MPLPKNLPGGPAKPPSAKKKDEVRILSERYRQENKLGSGAFGCAYLVIDLKANNERKVLKQILVAELQPDETVDAVREARLLAKLDHPSIVKFHDSFMERDFFCIVTEYCEGGDLDAKIQQWREAGKVFEESLILDWFIQLTTAVKYIHERRILHRDLKTRNIFLKNNLIKLGDFGISRILMGTSDMATTFTGTPYYMSPEVLKHDGYNAKSDIWSLGVVLYELCTLQHAFQGQNLMAVMYKIVEGEQPRLPDHFHPQLRTLFLKMLDKDPAMRPTAIHILQEPFIHQRIECWRGRTHDHRQVTSSEVAEEAEAIARALSPVKKKSLMPEVERALTPRERMELRKKQKADSEAEERRRLAEKNFSENQRRFEQQKKKQAKVIPPWVVEHPDVFTDPNFSLTQIDSTTSELLGTIPSAMEVSVNTELPQSAERLVDGNTMEMSVDGQEAPPKGRGGAEIGGERDYQNEQEAIPEDPLLAETHYSQFNDFESDSSSASEDDYAAFLGALEDALEPSNIPDSERVEDGDSHDELSPFTPLARQKRIALLKAQCLQIYGPENFQLVHGYLKSARSMSGIVDETAVMKGLHSLVSNVRDCFLVDQLVFLEKQAESEFAFI